MCVCMRVCWVMWGEGLVAAQRTRPPKLFTSPLPPPPHAHPPLSHQEYDKAIETYEAGLKHDPQSQELKEGLARCVDTINKVCAPQRGRERCFQGGVKGGAGRVGDWCVCGHVWMSDGGALASWGA